MKNRLALGLLFSAAFFVSACGNDPKENQDSTGETTTNQAGAVDASKLAKETAAKTWKWFEANYNKHESPDPLEHTWGPDCNGGTSSFVVLGALKSGVATTEHPKIKETIHSIIRQQQPSGAWDFGRGMRAVYLTSMAMQALAHVRDHGGETFQKAGFKEQVSAALGKGMEYLRRSQVGVKDGPSKDAAAQTDFTYGGWAYSEEELADPDNAAKPKANLSTTAFAMDAAAAFGVKKDDKLWLAAQVFLKRNQNSDEVNSGIVIKDNEGRIIVNPPASDPSYGGARYSPETSKVETFTAGENANEFHVPSYGSMTYALLRGYLHSGLKKGDQPVDLAYRWITNNFSVDNVPGFPEGTDEKLDMQGYFYQFMQMARTLSAYGEDKFEKKGVTINWKERMTNKLASVQKEDGSFVNTWNGRWEEGNAFIATGYTLIALSEIIGNK